MMKKLRGRNLAHPGCLIGLTLGLILGIMLAGVLAGVFYLDLSVVMLVWVIITFGLALAGWITGDRLSSRFPALEEDALSEEKPPSV